MDIWNGRVGRVLGKREVEMGFRIDIGVGVGKCGKNIGWG
jgi:hypothetical protein